MFLRLILDFLYPRECAVCRKPLSCAEMLCAQCALPATEEVLQTEGCLDCGEPLAGRLSTSSRCLACQLAPLPSAKLHSLWEYSLEVESAIKALKYRHQRQLAGFFAERIQTALLAEDEQAFEHRNWDLICALPSAPSATKRRGFSHMTLIAQALGKKLAVPVNPQALRAIGERARQVELPMEKRFKNVENSFRALPELVDGQRILLIDDVVTTGASLTEASKELFAQGAKSVDMLTLARSTLFQRNRLRYIFAQCNDQDQLAVS